MELSKNEIESLRNELEYKLKRYSSEKRINIDKDTLEQLLFEEGFLDGTHCKFIVWSGEFLSKIDLSEISFAGITWKAGYRLVDKNFYEASEEPIVLDNTNANINFFGAQKVGRGYNKNVMNLCSFKNLDLSGTSLGDYDAYNNCDFEGAKVDLFSIHDKIFDRCNFKNATIKNRNLNSVEFNEVFRNCNFSGTGINISHKIYELNDNDMEHIQRLEYLSKNYQRFGINPNNSYEAYINCKEAYGYLKDFVDASNNLEELLRKGYLDGCYINGEPFTNISQIYKKEKRGTVKTKYTDSILSDIDRQLKYVK